MARKHRRRTHKRSKRGGFLGPNTSATVEKGVQGWKDIGADVKSRAESGAQGIQQAATDVHSGYKNKTQPGAGMVGPVHRPPYSPPPMELPMELPMEPTKKKEAGGLLGLGWFGLGGRRTAHTSFVNKMLRVKNSRKRNRAIRKYLTGGKKRKTRKGGRRKRKRKTKKRRRR